MRNSGEWHMVEIRWAVEDRVCLFSLPRNEDEMREIAEKTALGVLVQLFDPRVSQEANLDWSKVAKEVGFEIIRIEDHDFEPPALAPGQLSALAKHAKEAFDADESVGIHCGMGIGRSGTMALLLMAELVRQAGSCSERPSQVKYIEKYLEDEWMGKC